MSGARANTGRSRNTPQPKRRSWLILRWLSNMRLGLNGLKLPDNNGRSADRPIVGGDSDDREPQGNLGQRASHSSSIASR